MAVDFRSEFERLLQLGLSAEEARKWAHLNLTTVSKTGHSKDYVRPSAGPQLTTGGQAESIASPTSPTSPTPIHAGGLTSGGLASGGLISGQAAADAREAARIAALRAQGRNAAGYKVRASRARPRPSSRPPAASPAAVAALEEKTADNTRLVGTVGAGGEQFRVSLAPVKHREKKEPVAAPVEQWSSSSFAWDVNPATTFTLPHVPWLRRLASVAVTVNGMSAPGTPLELHISPGADAAELFTSQTVGGVSGNIVCIFAHWGGTPQAGGGSGGSTPGQMVPGWIPADLWLPPQSIVTLRWTSPGAPFTLATIVGIIFRFENSDSAGHRRYL